MYQDGHESERLAAQVKLRYKLLRGQIIVFVVLLLAWAFLPDVVEFAKRLLLWLPW